MKPFENHVESIFDFAAIPTSAGLFYLKNHFTGIIFRLPIHDDIVLCPGNCWCWVTVFITRKVNLFSRFLTKRLVSRVCDHRWIFDLKNKTKKTRKTRITLIFFIMWNRHTNQENTSTELWYFSQKMYMYAAEANFYFIQVGKGLHGKSLVISKAKLVQSQ